MKPVIIAKFLYAAALYGFALAGLFFIGAFVLNRMNLTNVPGKIDKYSRLLQQTAVIEPAPKVAGLEKASNKTLAEIDGGIGKLNELKLYKMKNFCKVLAMNKVAGGNARDIVAVYRQTGSDELLAKMISAAEIRLVFLPGYTAEAHLCNNLKKDDKVGDLGVEALPSGKDGNVFAWTQDETWGTLRSAIVKDQEVISRVAELTGVESRLIVSAMFAEQSRMYRTQRGLYKKYLAPLKILASANQFSLGVMGIKPKTAEAVEKHLKDASSPFYLGPEYENLLDFKTKDTGRERYDRLSSEKDHFYSYLYGALYIKQVLAQWERAGMPIAGRPELVGTLFNIGFEHSYPNSNPQVGGSEMDINGIKYTYGALTYEFYYSGSLVEYFPFTLSNQGVKIR